MRFSVTLRPDSGDPVAAREIAAFALAAAFAQRFALRWNDGVLGLSFAAGEVDDIRFRNELLERLTGNSGADLSAGHLEESLLAAFREWDGLLLIDNYESVQQALEETRAPLRYISRADSTAEFPAPTTRTSWSK